MEEISKICSIIKQKQIGPFSATSSNLKNFPEHKGIYFWFMKPEGYELLLKYVGKTIHNYNWEIQLDNNYYLVYIGTAGTRKTKNNQTGLNDRIKWHICDKHSISNILHKTLSTLRQSLGALLSDNLLISENNINNFMSNYLVLTYISYENITTDVCALIDKDESYYIKNLRPLLNLKNNPNCKQVGHPTKMIKERRRFVMATTLEFIKNQNQTTL